MIQFLKELLNALSRFFIKSKLSTKVDKFEFISRYILHKKGKFSSEKKIVKYGAFMPAPNGETSIYRISGINNHEIWQIGQKYVAKPQNKNILARADFSAGLVFSQKLTIQPSPKPHYRHANIINWPKEKDEQKMLAIELANGSKLILP